METQHQVVVGDSREMANLDDGEVELVVTSPPYPMIEMWDEVFADLNSDIGDRLEEGDGDGAFDLMHEELNSVWDEITRVLTDGGIACINIGDATRKVDGSFELYPNHVRIVESFRERGFQTLPDVLWRKPTNKASKFMGSGMLPPNAYVTLEHEYILIFRKGEQQRSFEPKSDTRYEGAYFWEERNEWFSDIWMGIKGALQELDNGELRERSAAFPLEIPYRLINMYSVYGDTVLDPFWGSGTTSLAAMICGRNSIGYELKEEFTTVFDERVDDIPKMSREICQDRVNRHLEFVSERREEDKEVKYTASNYGFPVMTKQEKNIQFYSVSDVGKNGRRYTATHVPFESRDSQDFVDQADPVMEQSKLGSNFN